MVMIDGVEITQPNGSALAYAGTNWKEMSITDWVQFCKANEEFREPGITYDEVRALHEACEILGHRPLRIVETGMCFGTTTRYFTVRIEKYGGDLHTYEINVRPLFKEIMEKLDLWKHINVHGHSITDDYDKQKIDLLWIDSEHALQDALVEYVRFRPYLYEKSIIGFHDADLCPGVGQAITMIQEMDDLQEVAASVGRMSAGARLFKLVRRGRTDRYWHKMKGHQLCQVPPINLPETIAHLSSLRAKYPAVDSPEQQLSPGEPAQSQVEKPQLENLVEKVEEIRQNLALENAEILGVTEFLETLPKESQPLLEVTTSNVPQILRGEIPPEELNVETKRIVTPTSTNVPEVQKSAEVVDVVPANLPRPSMPSQMPT